MERILENGLSYEQLKKASSGKKESLSGLPVRESLQAGQNI